MGHVYRAKSFIADATAVGQDTLDGRGNDSMSKLVADYLDAADAGGGSTDIDEVISVASCRLKGNRIFTIVVIEDQTAGG